MFATLLELAGFALVVAAASLVSLPLALLVAGLGLLVAAGTLDAPKSDGPGRLRRRSST